MTVGKSPTTRPGLSATDWHWNWPRFIQPLPKSSPNYLFASPSMTAR